MGCGACGPGPQPDHVVVRRADDGRWMWEALDREGDVIQSKCCYSVQSWAQAAADAFGVPVLLR